MYHHITLSIALSLTLCLSPSLSLPLSLSFCVCVCLCLSLSRSLTLFISSSLSLCHCNSLSMVLSFSISLSFSFSLCLFLARCISLLLKQQVQLPTSRKPPTQLLRTALAAQRNAHHLVLCYIYEYVCISKVKHCLTTGCSLYLMRELSVLQH